MFDDNGSFLLAMFEFFIFFAWFMCLFYVFADIFRSHDMGGGAKALWCIFVIVLPFLGVFVYLIARGGKMQQHAVQDMQTQDAAARAYIQSAVASSSPADQIAQLADLKDKGVIDDAEFQR